MRNVSVLLDAMLARIRRSGKEEIDQVQHRLLEQPSRNDVLHGFRLILGREPEDEIAINAHMLLPTVADLRRTLIGSSEFQGKYKVMYAGITDHPGLAMERETVVFIHMQKTGGTTLQSLLERQFPKERVCPVHEDKLHLISVAELGRFDFFSGHFDRTVLRMIPRNEVKAVLLFRAPHARLISYYRFLRSHPPRDEFANDVLIRSANELSAEEFFENAETRRYASVYNHYLVALGSSFSVFERNGCVLSKDEISNAMGVAKRQIALAAAIGITERYTQSVDLICRALTMIKPTSISALHVTDDFAQQDTRFRRVPSVAMTTRLADALDELTKYDNELYEFAIQEFDRRRAGFATSEGEQ